MSSPLPCCCEEPCWKVFAPCCGEFLPGERRYVRCDVFEAIDWPGNPPVFKLDGICWSLAPDEPPPDPVPPDLVVDATDLTDLYEFCAGFGDACCRQECWYRATPCNCIGTPESGSWGVRCASIASVGIPQGVVAYIKITRNGQQQCWEIDTTIQYDELQQGWAELTWTAFVGTANGCYECCTGNPECCGCNGTGVPFCPPPPGYATIAWTLTPPGTDGIGATCDCVPPDSIVTLKVHLVGCVFACQDNGGFATANGCLGPYSCCLTCVPVGSPGCPPQMFWRLSIAVAALSTFDYELWESSGGAINACGDCDNEDSSFTVPPCDGQVCGGPEYLVTFRTPNLEACTCVPPPSAFTIVESKSSNVATATVVGLS